MFRISVVILTNRNDYNADIFATKGIHYVFDLSIYSNTIRIQLNNIINAFNVYLRIIQYPMQFIGKGLGSIIL